MSGFASKGKLRLLRKGGQVHCLYCPAESSKWELIHSVVVCDLELRGLQIQLRAAQGDSRAAVTLSNLQIEVTSNRNE